MLKQNNDMNNNNEKILCKSKLISGFVGSGKTCYIKKDLSKALELDNEKLIIVFEKFFGEHYNLLKTFEKEIIKINTNDIDFFLDNDLNSLKDKIILFNFYSESCFNSENEITQSRKSLTKIINDLISCITDNPEISTYIIFNELVHIMDEYLIDKMRPLLINKRFSSHSLVVTSFTRDLTQQFLGNKDNTNPFVDIVECFVSYSALSKPKYLLRINSSLITSV